MPQTAPLALGVMTSLHGAPREMFAKVRELGFETCQLSSPPESYLVGPDAARLTAEFKAAYEESGVTITAVFVMWSGHIWNLFGGPRTIGLVPADKRGARVVRAIRISNWARQVGIDALTSHIGFIPEDPADAAYPPFIETMQALVDYFLDNGQTFAFETGQETAQTLVRTIQDIGRAPHVGINLDPANLLLYGKSVPLEVADLVAPYVFNTHCKDGKAPRPGQGLGEEYPLGEGDVDIRALIPALYERGFRGPLTIEREISGDQQVADIRRAKALLEEIRERLLAGG
ncbi:MAG: sugar phosphate isomerase/epimerase [Fimbriimonadaceae bacterium]|nr:sugar phosphate isomerase/epimerase [Fimbriimonadaceae bacterium]